MLAAWVDGVCGTQLPLADRALHYGDAAFTTVRVYRQTACWIDAHLQRLQQSCLALRLPPPDWLGLRAEILSVAAMVDVAVIKVLLSRGDSARGYAPHGASGRRVLMAYSAPVTDEAIYAQGVYIRFADWVISEQPLLAGLKHANRLEQVMARSEWSDPDTYEALLCDASGNLVSATAANVFARFGNVLCTPALNRAGVAGVCRQQLVQSPPSGFSVTVADMARAQLFEADELFLSNALRGIVPVRALADHRYSTMSAARACMRSLHPTLGLPVPD